MSAAPSRSVTVALAKKLWPMKNETKLQSSPQTSATHARTVSFAVRTVTRRGTTVRVVRIVPVEYSEVMAMAPITATVS